MSVENLYTDIFTLRSYFHQQILAKEIHAITGTFIQIPLYYDKYIYYTKDPRVTLQTPVDLFRVESKHFYNQPFVYDKITAEIESQVLSRLDILVFLEQYKSNPRI